MIVRTLCEIWTKTTSLLRAGRRFDPGGGTGNLGSDQRGAPPQTPAAADPTGPCHWRSRWLQRDELLYAIKSGLRPLTGRGRRWRAVLGQRQHGCEPANGSRFRGRWRHRAGRRITRPTAVAASPISCPAGAPQLHIRGCVEIALAAADPDDQRGRTWHEYGCPAATSFFRPEAGGRRTGRLNRGWGVRTDPGLRRCSLWLIRAVSGSGWRMPVPCATTGTRSSVSKSSSRRSSWTLNGSMTGG